MDRRRADDALRAGDVDELLRILDGACSAREWEEVEGLRARSAAASEAGHQLWPVASRAAYLLALEAPARLAGPVLVEGSGRFAPGPLSEVAAQGHPWSDLAPHVPEGPVAVVTAHERVVRGEDLGSTAIPGPPVLDLPLALAEWEPSYALAAYRPDAADFPAPETVLASEPADATLPASVDAGPAAGRATDEVGEALRDTVRAWADESSGTVTVGAVGGDALAAIACVEDGTVQVARLDPGSAIARLAWAGASGGARGTRKGAAAGRFSAWWVAAALAGLLDDWPPDPRALGECVHELEWWTWDRRDATPSGWQLQLAVVDGARGRAWAVKARDAT